MWDIVHQESHARARSKEQEWAEADTRDKQVTFVVNHYKSPRFTPEQMVEFRVFLLPLLLRTSMSADSVKRVLSFFSAYLARPLRLKQRLNSRELFDPRAVEHFLNTNGSAYSDRMHSAITSAVRHLARALGIPGWARLIHIHKKYRRPTPYNDVNAVRHYAAARKLPEPDRSDAVALLDLTYGAGARARQVRDAFGRDVSATGDDTVDVRLVGIKDGLPDVHRPVAGPAATRLLERARSVGPDARLVCPHRSGKEPWQDLVDDLEDIEPSAGRFWIQRAADAWFVRGIESTGVLAFVESWQLSPGSGTLTELLGFAMPPSSDTQRAVLRRSTPIPDTPQEK